MRNKNETNKSLCLSSLGKPIHLMAGVFRRKSVSISPNSFEQISIQMIPKQNHNLSLTQIFSIKFIINQRLLMYCRISALLIGTIIYDLHSLITDDALLLHGKQIWLSRRSPIQRYFNILGRMRLIGRHA